MCIRHQIHRMYCDVRPLVAIARQLPSSEGTERKTIRKYVNPYETPLSCPSGLNHNSIRKDTNCPFNGCCRLRTVDLPCNCATKAAWGKEGPSEDITKCPHFREYHEYKHRTDTLAKAKSKNIHLAFDTTAKPFPEIPVLDKWVLLDSEVINVFCEPEGFCAGRLHLLLKGESLLKEYTTAASWEKRLALQGPLATDTLSQQEKDYIKRGVEKAWDESWQVQVQLFRTDTKRAKCLFWFSERDMKGEKELQPGVVSGWFVPPLLNGGAINPVREEMRMI